MNTKIFASSMFAIILMAAFVIAVVSISVTPGELKFTEDQEQLTFAITNNGNESLNLEYSTISPITQNGASASFDLTLLPLTIGASQTDLSAPVKLNGDPHNFDFGEYSRTLTITATDPSNDNVTQDVRLSFISSFCSNGAVADVEGIDIQLADLELDIDIDNRDGDDDEWELLDEIEIEVKVSNDGDDDMEDVEIWLGIFDSSGRDIADDMDYDNPDEEKLDVGDVNEDDDETDIFKFRVPADIDDGTYKVAIKAFSDEEGEENICIDFSNDLSDDFFERIKIDRVNDRDESIVVDDIFVDTQATCGDTVSGSFTVFNIGDDKEERVLILMRNNELKLDQEFEITQDFDEGDDETFAFSFTVPQDAQNKLYAIDFDTRFDYDNGFYDEQSADTYVGFVSVLGCDVGPGLPPTTGDILIDASLDSDARAGEELVVTSTLTNLGSEVLTVTVDARAFQSWADLDSVSPTVVSLNPGDSRTVTLTFTVDEDASGEQSFIIETNANGNIEIQEVEVNIEGEDGAPITGFTGFNLGGGGNLIWIIAIINIILIILIVVVAIRLSRR